MKNDIYLEIPQKVYDEWITDSFPQFQDENRKNSLSNLTINFSHCEWMSPLPMLSLATEVISKSQTGRQIFIDLGEGASTSQSAKLKSRTLKFLSFHRFLDTFLCRQDLEVRFQYDKYGTSGEEGVWHESSDALDEVKKLIERSKVDLVYGDSIVLPAKLWKVPSQNSSTLTDDVRAAVKKLLEHADLSLYKFKTESRKYRDVTLQRLTQVLLELVENASEHAYLDQSSGYVGIYARIRRTDSEDAASAKAKEINHSPLLNHVLLSDKQPQIEVFVTDVGRGLFADLAKWNLQEAKG